MNTTYDRTPMTPLRKTALIAGIAYIATFLFSIPVKFGLWTSVLDNPDFILGAGSEAGVPWGALFEVLTALGGVVAAVALYSVARRYSDRAALGFVTTRVLEATMIFVGVLSILAVYTLRQDVAGAAGADSGALLTARHGFVAIHDWAFLIGPGVMAGLNALCIGSVMYRSRLLPRWIPTLGLIGAPLLLGSCNRHPVRRLGAALGPGHDPGPAGRHLGDVLRRVHGREGVQALPCPGRLRRQHPGGGRTRRLIRSPGRGAAASWRRPRRVSGMVPGRRRTGRRPAGRTFRATPGDEARGADAGVHDVRQRPHRRS